MTKTYGNFTDFIDFSRSSGGTALRRVSYGADLVDTANDATSWNAYGTNTVEQDGDAVKITYVDNSQGAYAYMDEAGGLSEDMTVGVLYRLSYKVKINTGNATINFYDGSVSNVQDNFSSTSFITQTFNFVFSGGSRPFLNVASNLGSGEELSIKDIKIEVVTFDQPSGDLVLFNHPDDIPRVEYDANGTVKGLLIEEARTNLVTYSEDFTNASWIKAGASVSSAYNELTEKNDACEIKENSAFSTQHRLYENVVINNSTTYSASVFVKRGAGSRNIAIISVNAGVRVYFDLGSGVVGEEYAGTGKIVDMGNGWYWCSATGTSTSTLTAHYIAICDGTTTGSETYDGDGTSSILIYGAQLEQGSFPTSYIPTSGSSVTRSPDIASIATSNFGYNQKAGTVVVEQSTFDDVKNAVVWQIDDGTPSNRYVFNAFNGNTTVVNGAATQASLTHTGQDVNVTYRHGFGYKLNSFASVYDGGNPVTDATGTLPTVSTLRFGSDSTTNAIINGHIKSIKYLPRRNTNTQLQEFTS